MAAGGAPSAAYHAAQAALVAAVDAVFTAARQEEVDLSAAAQTAEGAEKSALRAQAGAVRSLLEHKQGLRVFLTDPRVPPTTTRRNAPCAARSSPG